MATLDSLKSRLTEEAELLSTFTPQPLSHEQYNAGYDIVSSGRGRLAYNQFITPQLSKLLSNLESHSTSVLEIGPGPMSVLAQMPYHTRQSIKKYAAFEPNDIFATCLESCLGCCSQGTPLLPCLEKPVDIRRMAFTADTAFNVGSDIDSCEEAFDVILFCHSMYGMKPKKAFLEKALGMLAEGGMVVVFHRGESLFFEDMVCHRTAFFPTGKVSVKNDDYQVGCFASFIAGFSPSATETGRGLMFRWRKICREMGVADGHEQDSLWFRSAVVMVVFTKNATALPKLVAKVPGVELKKIKNRDARLQRSAAYLAPIDIAGVQHCVRWAIENKFQLTVVSGGHSDHCIRSNVVAIDMANFNETIIVRGDRTDQNPQQLVVAGCGCKTEDIVRQSIANGLMIPLGSRPSTGSGLWLQGGIGHLTRQHGLSCDAIVGAVMVTVDTGQIVYAGAVPTQYQPPHAKRATNEDEVLWGLKGAGTNFGIVVHVVFRAFTASVTAVRSWSYCVASGDEAQHELSLFEECVAKKLPNHCSADVYLHCSGGRLLLGGTIFERHEDRTKASNTWPLKDAIAVNTNWQDKDAIELFNADLYMTVLNGGHKSGRMSSFKRCVFLRGIGDKSTSALLVRAYDSRPSDLCYLHFLHGGGTANEVRAEDTAFGCRDWTYACVITAVWPREKDYRCADEAKEWVYRVANDLLPLSSGVYGADLGPEPRDIVLAQKAFGPNLARLSRLKKTLDPLNVLAYTCPFPKRGTAQKLVILVTGESCAGKDYCAEIWASGFAMQDIAVRVASISDVTKLEFARVTGADGYRLLWDRAYKETHRENLTAFFQAQMQQKPNLPEEHFKAVVDENDDVDVLIITGMRDEAPVTTLSHLVPQKKVVEVHVTASRDARQSRKRCDSAECGENSAESHEAGEITLLGSTTLGYEPDFIFANTMAGESRVSGFAKKHLFPLVSGELSLLADMIRTVPNFPLPGIEFRHVLNIPQLPRGLAISTSLLRNQFRDWKNTGAIACCEAGGFIYASALALQVDVPLVAIRKSGKLPPPTISVAKVPSHISSPISGSEERIEMNPDAISRTASVVVVDDVLATGRTLLAILQLLRKAGISAENVSVLVVAEFPIHRGRALLRRSGFGVVRVQSLLVFGGA